MLDIISKKLSKFLQLNKYIIHRHQYLWLYILSICACIFLEPFRKSDISLFYGELSLWHCSDGLLFELLAEWEGAGLLYRAARQTCSHSSRDSNLLLWVSASQPPKLNSVQAAVSAS